MLANATISRTPPGLRGGREVVRRRNDAGPDNAHDDVFPSPGRSPDEGVGAGEELEVVATSRTRISADRLRSLSRAARSSSARSDEGMNKLTWLECETLRSTAIAPIGGGPEG